MKYNMTQEEIDDIVLSSNLDLCVLAVKLGFGLDVFFNDDCDTVRGQVARQGYGLDKLVNDGSGFVRRCVAEQGYGLDILVDDEHPYVRAEVARQGFGLVMLKRILSRLR